MAWLIDSGVLLRYVQPRDPNYEVTRAAIQKLRAQRQPLYFTQQNMAEFWTVATRPLTARGGLGMSVSATDARARMLERAFLRLTDTDTIYSEWRRLVVAHGVSGVAVHDVRLVASMLVHGITGILTFNTTDFTRFPGITAVDPASV